MSEPEWLNETEQQAWRGLLHMYQLLFDGLDRQLRRDAGIPHAYYMILAMLSESPDRSLRMTELANRTATSQSRTSHAVAALEDRGWVERRPCESDRRGHFAVLTDAGYDIIRAAAPGHVAEVRRLLFDHLTEEQVLHLRAIGAAITE